MKTRKPAARTINLLTLAQISAIADGIEKSAFTISTDEGAGIVSLSVAGRPVFTINFADGVITRKRGNGEEHLYTRPPRRFWNDVPRKLFDRLEEAVRMQYAMGGQEALTTNLITRSEVVVLIDAIRAMAFKIEHSITNQDVYIVSFEGRQCFRIDADSKVILMVALSGNIEPVYTFSEEPVSWFWTGTDRKLWRDLNDALTFYCTMMHKVRMSDYRAMFGNQMQKVIVGLAQAMDEAEAEVRMLEKVDKTDSGRNLHPEVARLVQKDLDAGEERAQEQP